MFVFEAIASRTEEKKILRKSVGKITWPNSAAKLSKLSNLFYCLHLEESGRIGSRKNFKLETKKLPISFLAQLGPGA